MASPETAVLRRRLGLSARASALAAAVLAAIAALCALTVMLGLEGESRRHQMTGAREVANRVVRYSIPALMEGDFTSVGGNVARMASRSEVRRASVHDMSGAIVSGSGGDPLAEERALIAETLRTGRTQTARSSAGELIVVQPIPGPAGQLGAAAITIKPEGFRYDAMLALAPFFLLIVCLGLVAIPLISHLIARALRPLDLLTRLAEQYAASGRAEPLHIRTGDEFETLANAFNQMIARIDASMRRIQQIAFVDPATQLPNQERFLRELEFFMLRAEQDGQVGAVMIFEFERLRHLMQTLGPDAARELLQVIAERFRSATRTTDRILRLRYVEANPALAARIGAHEFAALLPGVSSPADAARFAQHLNGALDQTFEWRGHKVSLGSACGVALAPRDGKDADATIRHARMALAAAHRSAGRVKAFTPSLDRAAMARLTLEQEMRAALERNEFRAFFQPKVEFSTCRVVSAEALARWVRPDGQVISPAKFIPAAEENGLIEALSNAIMREACWKAASWARAGAPAKVAVNVSALQFGNERFAEHVLQVVHHAGLPPNLLELEITESVAMENPERARRLIETLRAAGVSLAIDDFGCGHSNLAALSRLPFDVIKIDQHFVRALNTKNAHAEAIIEMILAMGRSLGLDVVAEGIERRDQADFMAARGCRWGQGFLYGAAVPAHEFAEMLRVQALAAADAA